MAEVSSMPPQDVRESRPGLVHTLVTQTWTILRKDLLLEWRGRSRMVSVVLFGTVTLVLFSFAVGPDSTALRAGAAGFLVLALLLSSTLSLSESFRFEQEQRAMEGLLLLPVDAIALFYGKALRNMHGTRERPEREGGASQRPLTIAA